jgi:hypothetical protein
MLISENNAWNIMLMLKRFGLKKNKYKQIIPDSFQKTNT